MKYTYPLGKTFSASILRKAFGAVRSTCVTGMGGGGGRRGDREKTNLLPTFKFIFKFAFFSIPLIAINYIHCKTEITVLGNTAGV